jgi:sterol desaturase/sphingolipid hydroxylase (fatty acid hydroxylase superfamily)
MNKTVGGFAHLPRVGACAITNNQIWSRAVLDFAEPTQNSSVMLWQYWFWLVVLSLLFVVLERFFPARLFPQQPQLWKRHGFFHDLCWLAINGHFFGLAIASLSAAIATWMINGFVRFGLPDPQHLRLLSDLPIALQILIVLVSKDFLDWCIHNLLHRVPILWRFHQIHHSITEMDFIGNFRFHSMEIIMYRSLTWLPMLLLGAHDLALFIVALLVTLIGFHNHSNLRTHWGIGNYLLNSPRFHLWHHDYHLRSAAGVPAHGSNFAIVFTCWDWLFGTAYFPNPQSAPERLGFVGDEHLPTSFIGRFAAPFYVKKK